MARIVVGVINYNYARFLRECLTSIDQQEGVSDMRVIVVDDCSSDESQDVITEWAASSPHQTELVFKSLNSGPGDSYNTVIRRLRPEDEFLAMLDADDYWLPGKSVTQLAAFANAPLQTAVIYSDAILHDDSSGLRRYKEVKGPPADVTAAEYILSHQVFTPLNSTLIRASMVREIDASLRVCDLQLWLALARMGKFVHAPGFFSVTRLHGGSMSGTEKLREDRLKILARYPTNRVERSWARRRGRAILRASALTGPQPSISAYMRYVWSLRDIEAVILMIARLVPGNQAIFTRLVGLVGPWGNRRPAK